MSSKYQFNDLLSYNHSYYWNGKQQYQRHNYTKNANFNNRQKQEKYIQKSGQLIRDDNNNHKFNGDDNIQESKENAINQQNIDKIDQIQNYDQQTEYQEKQTNRNCNNEDKLERSSNDQQSSIDQMKQNIGRKRKSQIDWLYSTQINQENILIMDRVKLQNLFSPTEIIHLDENSLLYEIEIKKQKITNCKIIECKFLIQKSVKKLRLLQLDVLFQCSKCKQIIQAKTNVIKKTQSPAIFVNHCNQNIRIDFIHNHNENPNNQDHQITHVAYVDSNLERIVIIYAQCAVICECDNENDSLIIFDNPLQLKDGFYTLLANESYRKLCRFCCKEVILQQCEFMILS